MNNELTIVRKENIELIISNAPTAYNENTISRQRCVEAGKTLLASIQEQGMTDELDQQAAAYIDKARKTVGKMKDKRSALTKLFDEIRSTFTGMENEIDPAKSGTVPYLIQAERDRYAAKRRKEEEKKRQELIMRQQAEQMRTDYRYQCASSLQQLSNAILDERLKQLDDIYTAVTLDNYELSLRRITQFGTTITPDTLRARYTPYVDALYQTAVPQDERRQIAEQVFEQKHAELLFSAADILTARKDYCLSMMPSKKQELERAAQASAIEAEQIRKQMADRDAEESARLEAERKQKELQELQAAAMKQQADNLSGLFGTAEASIQGYTSKSSVKKRLVPLNVEAFPEIISMWWTQEGQFLTIEELTKLFKKQITFCEKQAKQGTLIQSEHIAYEDEVKAK